MMEPLKIYGKDFSEFTEARFSMNGSDIKQIELDDGNIIELTDSVKEKLILKILENPENIIRNSSTKGNERKQPLYEDFNGLRFGGFAGVVSTKIKTTINEIDDTWDVSAQGEFPFELNVILQIQSRFDVEPQKPFFLATMLMGESNLKLSETDIPSNDDELFDFLLIIRFKNCLQNAYLKGFYRTYQEFYCNDNRVRGSIDVARHIKNNMGLNAGKVSYHYRENTIDNYLNHLIVAAYLYFKKLHPDLTDKYIDNDFETKSIITTLMYSIGYPKYDVKYLISKNLSRIAHPYYTEYEALRVISLRILRNEGLSFFDGIYDDIEGVLYYIPDLFEDFLAGLFDSNGFVYKPQYEARVFSYKSGSDFKQTIRPDYVFFKQNSDVPYMILDAKFKPAWSEAIFKGDSLGSILLDDYSECIRNMNAFLCHATGVIFPTNKDLKPPNAFIEHGISKYNDIDRFYTIPLFVPENSGDYENWKKRFDNSCISTIDCLRDYLSQEENYHNNVVPRPL